MRRHRMHATSSDSLQELIDYCASLPSGAVTDVCRLEGLLANAWNVVDSASCGGMKGMKLFSRTENLCWNPPLITFVIERHGGTVMGSSRAELQHWEVNIEEKQARIVRSGRRQLSPPDSNYPMEGQVAEVLDAILNGSQDARFQWKAPNDVKILSGTVFPKGSAYKQTLEGRRKRFRTALAKCLVENGWEQVAPNQYRKT
ncbi:MAG: hypothetical protein ACJ8LM_16930 [Candidatus Udaeobacter sp.]